MAFMGVRGLKFLQDGWENILTGLGTARDKRTHAQNRTPDPSIKWQVYEDLYHGDDLARNIVDTPSQEMVKNWISIAADDNTAGKALPPVYVGPGYDNSVNLAAQLRTDDAAAISSFASGVQTARDVLMALEQLQAQTKLFEAEVWAQVMGGSLLFLGINDGGAGRDSMSLPLDEENIQSFEFLTVYDRSDVYVYKYYEDPNHPKAGLPMLYGIVTQSIGGPVAGVTPVQTIHESRCIRFDGKMVNRRRRARNGGWGDSIYVALEDMIRDYATTWGGVANLMQDFSQAVFKMRGLAEAMIQDKDGLVIRRIKMMDMARAVGRVLPIDGESEEFTRQQTPVTGLADLLDRMALRVASAARMPVTLLMGDSPSGMNATGDSDFRWFFDHIKSRQEKELRPVINRLISLIFKSKKGPTAGKTPKSWSFVFNPLWQQSEAEIAKNRNTQAQTDQIYINSGVVSSNEVAIARFGGDRYSYETSLDPSVKRDNEAKSKGSAGAPGMDEKLHPSQKETPKGGA